MQSIGLRQSSRLLAVAAVALSLSYITGCLQQETAVKGNVAVLLKAEMGNTKSANEECLNSGDIASLHVTVDDVQFERLTDSGSELISVLDAPVALDVAALQDIGTILAATSLPAGDYIGGMLMLSNAEVSLASAPDVFLPVVLPDSGVLAFDADFSIEDDDDGVLKLKLKRVRICMMPDDSLYLKTTCGFEAEVERHGSSGDDDEHDGYITAEFVEAFGRVDDLGDNAFKMKIKDQKVLVDFSKAEILLPPATEGGDPVVGGPEDLEEGAEVLVYGTLALQEHFVILADTVQVVAWSQDDDDDHDGDHDGDDDDDGDDDHDGDDDDDDDGHHGGGTFDENGNTTGFGIPDDLIGNAFAGEELWNTSCAICHPSPYGEVEAEPFREIKEELREVEEMQFLNLTRQQIADITAYLNWDGSGTPPPPPAPDAPVNVQASDGTFASKVAVTWNASTDATGYEVWRNAADDSAGAALVGDPVGTSFDDLTAVAGTTYFYWVKASNTNGTSGFSASDSGFRADTPPPAPDPPTNVQASDGTFTDKVSVTWNASTGATNYEVWRNTSNDSAGAALVGDPVGTSFDDLAAVVGTTYFYWVKASNTNGTSGFSASDSGFRADTPPPAPDPPTNVQASDGTFTDKVSVTWNASTGATNYEVWRNTSNDSAGATLIGDPVGTSYEDLSAVQGTTYFYWVKASNLSGTSGFSTPDSGFAATSPSGPFDENGNTTAYDIPSGLVGNIAAGTTEWNNNCAVCHPAPFGAVGAFTYPALENKLLTVPLMAGVSSITDQQKADLTAYLNRADATP